MPVGPRCPPRRPGREVRTWAVDQPVESRIHSAVPWLLEGVPGSSVREQRQAHSPHQKSPGRPLCLPLSHLCLSCVLQAASKGTAWIPGGRPRPAKMEAVLVEGVETGSEQPHCSPASHTLTQSAPKPGLSPRLTWGAWGPASCVVGLGLPCPRRPGVSTGSSVWRGGGRHSSHGFPSATAFQ